LNCSLFVLPTPPFTFLSSRWHLRESFFPRSFRRPFFFLQYKIDYSKWSKRSVPFIFSHPRFCPPHGHPRGIFFTVPQRSLYLPLFSQKKCRRSLAFFFNPLCSFVNLPIPPFLLNFRLSLFPRDSFRGLKKWGLFWGFLVFSVSLLDL